MIHYILINPESPRYKERVLDYQEGKSKLIDALYGDGYCSLHISNKSRGNYILLLRIPHVLPDNAGSWIIPLKSVPEEAISVFNRKHITIREAIKLFEEYHG